MSNEVIPVVKAEEPEVEEEEEDLVDPLDTLKEQCSQKQEAQGFWTKFQQCQDRVNSRSNTAETCEEEFIDYVQVVDKCVSKDIFKRLK